MHELKWSILQSILAVCKASNKQVTELHPLIMSVRIQDHVLAEANISTKRDLAIHEWRNFADVFAEQNKRTGFVIAYYDAAVSALIVVVSCWEYNILEVFQTTDFEIKPLKKSSEYSNPLLRCDSPYLDVVFI